MLGNVGFDTRSSASSEVMFSGMAVKDAISGAHSVFHMTTSWCMEGGGGRKVSATETQQCSFHFLIQSADVTWQQAQSQCCDLANLREPVLHLL